MLQSQCSYLRLMKRIFSLILLALTPGILSAQVSLDLRLDNSSYSYGDPAELCIDFTNNGPETTTQSYQDCFYWIEIDRQSYSFNQFQIGSCEMDCSLTIQEFQIQPGETQSICSNFVMEDKNMCSVYSPSNPDVQFSIKDRHHFSAFGTEYEVIMTGLAVEFGSFNLSQNEEGHALEWTTLNEVNNQGFEVQRSQGSHFETLGFVNGNGTSNQPNSYYYLDGDGLDNNTSYLYRLRQIDHDGSFTYSKEIESTTGGIRGIEIGAAFPNPFRADASFTVFLPVSQEIEIVLFDELGREVQQVFEGSIPAYERREIQLSKNSLPSGRYYYAVKGRDFRKVKSVVIR